MTDDSTIGTDETMAGKTTVAPAVAATVVPDDDEAEAQAIISITRALKPLAPDARRRVIEWAVAKYGASVPTSGAPRGATDRPSADPRAATPSPATGGGAGIDPEAFEDFASLCEAAQPANDLERTIAACYWVQVRTKKHPFISQDANTLLKNLGHQIKDITVPFDALRARTPSLVIQIKKDGSHQQSRKQYRLTPPGIKLVVDAIRDGGFPKPEAR